MFSSPLQMNLSGPKKVLRDHLSTVPVRSTRNMIRRELEKTRNYRFLPGYLFFLLCFAVTLFTRYVPFFSDLAPFFTTNSVREYALQETMFEEVDDVDDIFRWLSDTVARVYAIRSAEDVFQVVPLGVVVLRQMRTTLNPCVGQAVMLLPPHERLLMPEKCPPPLSFRTVAAPPFGVGPPRPTAANLHEKNSSNSSNSSAAPQPPQQHAPLFFPERMRREHSDLNFVPRSRTLFAPNYNFVYQEDEFVETIFFTDPPELSLAIVDWMRDNGWIDQSTKAIAIDTTHFDKTRGVIMQVSFVLEMTTPVNFEKTIVSSEVPYLSLGESRSNYLFFTDVATLAGVAFLVVDLVTQARDNYVLGRRRVAAVFSFWSIVTAFIIIAGLVCFGLQMEIWRLSLDDQYDETAGVAAVNGSSDGGGGGGPHTANSTQHGVASGNAVKENALRFHHRISRMSNLVRLSMTLSAAAFIAAGFKLFYYLRYISGLNMITETLRYATRSLLSLGIIMFGLLFIFSAAGTILFGSSIRQVRTFPNCFSYMTRVLISQDINAYDQFSAVSRVAAVFFFGTYFLLFWIVLLNSVLGIIAHAFEVAEQERVRRRQNSRFDEPDNALTTMRRAFVMHFFHLDPRFKVNRQSPQWGSPLSNLRHSSSVRAAEEALMHYPSYRKRLALYRERREHLRVAIVKLGMLAPSNALTFDDLKLICCDLHIIDCEMIFDRTLALQDSQADAYATTIGDVMEEVLFLRRDVGFWLQNAHPELSENLPSVVASQQATMAHDVPVMIRKIAAAESKAAAAATTLKQEVSLCEGSSGAFAAAANDAAPDDPLMEEAPLETPLLPAAATAPPATPIPAAQRLPTTPGEVVPRVAPRATANEEAELLFRCERMYELYDPEKRPFAADIARHFASSRRLLAALVKRHGPEPSDAQLAAHRARHTANHAAGATGGQWPAASSGEMRQRGRLGSGGPLAPTHFVSGHGGRRAPRNSSGGGSDGAEEMATIPRPFSVPVEAAAPNTPLAAQRSIADIIAASGSGSNAGRRGGAHAAAAAAQGQGQGQGESISARDAEAAVSNSDVTDSIASAIFKVAVPAPQPMGFRGGGGGGTGGWQTGDSGGSLSSVRHGTPRMAAVRSPPLAASWALGPRLPSPSSSSPPQPPAQAEAVAAAAGTDHRAAGGGVADARGNDDRGDAERQRQQRALDRALHMQRDPTL